jgi:hypothetical protein
MHVPSLGMMLSMTSWIKPRSFNLMDIIKAANTQTMTHTNIKYCRLRWFFQANQQLEIQHKYVLSMQNA